MLLLQFVRDRLGLFVCFDFGSCCRDTRSEVQVEVKSPANYGYKINSLPPPITSRNSYFAVELDYGTRATCQLTAAEISLDPKGMHIVE